MIISGTLALDDTVTAILARDPRDVHVALVGASNDPSKYGNRILHNLERKGFVVRPVNATSPAVDGRPAYPSVADVPKPVDIVNIVVPPHVTHTILMSLDPDVFPVVWLQPGSFDEGVAAFAANRFEHAVIGDCIMVQTR